MAEPRVVLVTGSRKGLGKALAEHFLARGERVEGASRGEASIEHPSYRHHRLDVVDERAVRELMAAIRQAHGRLDALVNNAGAAAMNHSLLTPLDTARKLVETNLLGTFVVSREAARLMQAKKRGRIVNLTSIAVPLHLEGEAMYAASKAAVESLTRTLAHELGAWNITVNAVGPGPIDTDLIRGVPREKLEALQARLAVRRPGTPADVVHAIEFFLAEESDLVSGQVLYLGGP